MHEHVAGPAELEVNAEFGAAHNLKPHFESVARLDLFEYALGGARRDLQVQNSHRRSRRESRPKANARFAERGEI